MPSSYSQLKIELIGTGEQTGTWGQTTNNNFQYAIEEAITGTTNVVFSNADLTLSLTNSNFPQTARNLRLVLTGTATTPLNLVVPNIQKFYIITNTLTNNITVKTLAGTGVVVPSGATTLVYNDTIDVYDAVNYLSYLALGTPLEVQYGGTGTTTSTGTGSVVLSNSPALTTPNLDTPSAGVLTNCTGLPLTGAAGVTGTLPVFNGGTGVTTSTGSGSVVLSNSPALTTPNLGTPSAGTLTNCTGLPLGSVTGLGTNVSTFLATPTSANLASAVTDETGSGALVFGSTPTISNANLTGTVTGNASYSSITLTTPNIDSAPVPTVSGTAPIYGVRSWVNFNPTLAAAFPGGTSTVTRVAGSTTATINCANNHLLKVGMYVYAASGVVAGPYMVQTVVTVGVNAGKQFTITTAATTALAAVAITFTLFNIRSSGNVNSVVLGRSGGAGYIINFETALPNANYTAVGSSGSVATQTSSTDNTVGIGCYDNSTGIVYSTQALACMVTTNGTFEADPDVMNIMVLC